MTDNRYYIKASWEGRAETPDELAVRFLRLIDSLKQIDPVFSLWTCGAKRPKKFETMRDRYAEEIAADVTTDDGHRKIKPIRDGTAWCPAQTRA